MIELLSRLARHPLLTTELLVGTLFITVLNLASPIFVIQVLNRFITHGITGTLITLTAGMLIAMLLQFFFRLIRTRIASDISVESDQKLATQVLDTLSNANALELLDVGRSKLQECSLRLQHIRNGYSGANITNFLDGPFAVLYLLAAFIISPLLAGIGLVAIGIGIHPVHFGIIMVANLCIGLCTPPVGSCLFLGCGVGRAKIAGVSKAMIPFYIAMVGALLLITYWEPLSLWLPRALGELD